MGNVASISAISALVREILWTFLTCICLEHCALNTVSHHGHFNLCGQCLNSMWRFMSAGLFINCSHTLHRKPLPGIAVVILAKSYLVEAASEIWPEKTLYQYVNWGKEQMGNQCNFHISNLGPIQTKLMDHYKFLFMSDKLPSLTLPEALGRCLRPKWRFTSQRFLVT